MRAVVVAVVGSVACVVRSRWALQMEVLALRHQLAVYQRAARRPHLRPADRILWAWLSRAWAGWREALVFVQPHTVIAWQQQRFRDHGTRVSRRGRIGRPPVAKMIRGLIRQMSDANPTWGSPRIAGELRKLGIEVAKSTVERYRGRRRKPPSPTWRAFLASHATELGAIDFFTGATVRFEGDEGATGWNAPATAPWLEQVLQEASSAFYGKPAAAMGEGGTIPFMAMLGKHFPDAQFLITGVLGPKSNAHGPNEFLHIPYATKLTACVATVLAAHAARGSY